MIAYPVCKWVKLLKVLFWDTFIGHNKIQVLITVPVECAGTPKKTPDFILIWVAAIGPRPAISWGKIHLKILYALCVLIVLFSLHWIKYFLKCIMLIFFRLKWATFILVLQGPKICLVCFMDLKYCPSSLGSHQIQVIDAWRTPKMSFPSFPCTILKISLKFFFSLSILAIVFPSDIFSLDCSW